MQPANNQTLKMPLPCLLKEQICCHLLPPLLEGTPPQLPPKKLERPFALFGPNPNVNIPELNSIAASYIIKIIFMSMPKSTQSNLNFDNHIWLTTMMVSNSKLKLARLMSFYQYLLVFGSSIWCIADQNLK